jgi:hypothetical protein
MKKSEIIILQIFAVVASYLIAAMPLTSAVQMSIIKGTEQTTASLPDLSELVQKEISYPYQGNLQYVRIKLYNKTVNNVINKVYMYKCRGFSPTECLNSMQPVVSINPITNDVFFDQTFSWNDVKSGTVANFLILAKLNINGKRVWTGDWTKITYQGPGSFESKTYTISELQLYAKSDVSIADVKTYIENNYSVPSNWIDHSIFSTIEGMSVTNIYEISGNENSIDPSGTGVPSFSRSNTTGNTFNGINKDWGFVFGGDGKIASPIAFYSNAGIIPATCGNNRREGSEQCDGTDSSACPGQCSGCRCPTAGANLFIDDWQPRTIKCSDSGSITVTAHVNNPGTIGNLLSYNYTVNGVKVSPPAVVCSQQAGKQYSYTCDIRIQNIPNCNSLGATPNLNLIFGYVNNVQLTSDSFMITITSSTQTCGNNIREGSEQCDGTDSPQCLGQCRTDCICPGESPQLTLSITSASPNPFNCESDSTLAIGATVTNQPSGTPSYSYSFDGTTFSPLTCSASGSQYTCTLSKDKVCDLLQESLSLKLKFSYSGATIISGPADLWVTFPPPSMGIDTTPITVTEGGSESFDIILHVNYPNSITYTENDFEYKYLSSQWTKATCTLYSTETNKKTYSCPVTITIPSGTTGTKELKFRLKHSAGYLSANGFINIQEKPSLSITSVSPNPFNCESSQALTVKVTVNNPPSGTPSYSYSFDGTTFSPLTCSASGSQYTCTLSKDKICSIIQEKPALQLKFSYPGTELISPSQIITVVLIRPYMIANILPSPLPAGVTQATASLRIRYTSLVGSNIQFKYSYLDKPNQTISCTSQNDHGNDGSYDTYECSASFDIPAQYAGSQIDLWFYASGQLSSVSAKKTVSVGYLPALTVFPSSIRCSTDTELTLQAKVSNPPQNTPNNYFYSFDGITFIPLQCSGSGVQYTCKIPKDDVCGNFKNSLTITLKFSYQGMDITGSQKIVVHLPAPSMDVLILPTGSFPAGTAQATIHLSMHYPEMVGDSIQFKYQYLVFDQSMACSLESGSGPDGHYSYYKCSQVAFSLAEHTGETINVIFSGSGNKGAVIGSGSIQVSETGQSGNEPWLEIVNPPTTQVAPGNSTNVNLVTYIHNADKNNLSHAVTLAANTWVKSGTCTENSGLYYQYDCNIVVGASPSTAPGAYTPNLTLRVTDAQGHNPKNLNAAFDVIVTQSPVSLENVQISPNELNCEAVESGAAGAQKSLVFRANVKNLASPYSIYSETVKFNEATIFHTDRYCTVSNSMLSCEIPVLQILDIVKCGQGDLIAGGGSRQYPLSLTIMFKKGESFSVAKGTADVKVSAPVLKPNLVIDIPATNINCIKPGSLTLTVKVENADLMHDENTPIAWSYVINAYSADGKTLSKSGDHSGDDDINCAFQRKDSVRIPGVGIQTNEIYECKLLITTKMFSGCEYGNGKIILKARGKKAVQESFDITVSPGEDYVFDFEMTPIKGAEKCQITDYEGTCSLRNPRMNTTITFTGDVPSDLRIKSVYAYFEGREDLELSTPMCAPDTTQEANLAGAKRYRCYFSMDSYVDTPREGLDVEDLAKREATDRSLSDYSIGTVHLSLTVSYADNLRTKTLTKADGTLVLNRLVSTSLLSQAKNTQMMKNIAIKVQKAMEWIVRIGSFCAVCCISRYLVDKIGDAFTTSKNELINQKSAYDEQIAKKSEIEKTLESKKSLTSQEQSYLESLQSERNKLMGKSEELSFRINKLQDSLYEKEGTGSWIAMVGIFAVIAYFLAKFSFQESDDRISKAMHQGMQLGLICFVWKLLIYLSSWSKTGKVGQTIQGTAEAEEEIVGSVCKVCGWLGKNAFSLINLGLSMIRMYMGYKCIENVNEAINAQEEMRRSGEYESQGVLMNIEQQLSAYQSCFNMMESGGAQASSNWNKIVESGQRKMETFRIMRDSLPLQSGDVVCDDETLKVKYTLTKASEDQVVTLRITGPSPSPNEYTSCSYEYVLTGDENELSQVSGEFTISAKSLLCEGKEPKEGSVYNILPTNVKTSHPYSLKYSSCSQSPPIQNTCPEGNCIDTSLGWGASNCEAYGGYYNPANPHLDPCGTDKVCCKQSKQTCEIEHANNFGSDKEYYCRDSNECDPGTDITTEAKKCYGLKICCKGKQQTGSENLIDTTPPAANNIAVSFCTSNSCTLTWTAPGDDGSSGTASQYDIRYSTSITTTGNWDSATQATGEPAPQIAGTTQTMTVTGLSPSNNYYFAMKTADEVPNWSGLSNTAPGTISAGTSENSPDIEFKINRIDPDPPIAGQDLTVYYRITNIGKAKSNKLIPYCRIDGKEIEQDHLYGGAEYYGLSPDENLDRSNGIYGEDISSGTHTITCGISFVAGANPDDPNPSNNEDSKTVTVNPAP